MTNQSELDELREKLAAVEHERWSDWQRWVHKKARTTDQGHILIDREDVERWERQIATPYSQLSRKEQLSDIEQVDRYLQLILDWHNKQVRKAKPEPIRQTYDTGTRSHGYKDGYNQALEDYSRNLNKLKESKE